MLALIERDMAKLAPEEVTAQIWFVLQKQQQHNKTGLIYTYGL